MMGRLIVCMALALSALMFVGDICAQENWPQWRGPDQNGVGTATGLPLTWSGTENIVWKTPLPSWSGATPIIWGDRIFVTSPSESEAGGEQQMDDEEDRDPGGSKLLLLCSE